MTYRKKLIEVALPLAEINDASAFDKRPGIGAHPKGIHQWWARLPLPTARAVLFASVVDDPSAHPERFPTEDAQNAERDRLFAILRRLMQKKLHEHPGVYAEARAEMLAHCGDRLPLVLDPFAGGGSIPLEANRLGFEAHAGDLNPVAVLLNKCNLEFAPRWAEHPPVNPSSRAKIGGTDSWRDTHGLAADVRYYGARIRQKAIEKIGHLYLQVQAVREKDGSYRHATDEEIKKKSSKVETLNVIAWIWARTVASPNPATRGAHVPLLSTYWLSSKKGQLAWLRPVVDRKSNSYHFEVRTGTPRDPGAIKAGTKLSSKGFRCLLTDSPIDFEHIRDQSRQGRMDQVLAAIVVEIPRGRIYLPADDAQIGAARVAHPSGYPDSDLPDEALGFRIQNYGIRKHWQMFTPRQLAAMVTLSDLVRAVRADVLRDGKDAGLDKQTAEAYAATVVTLLALALDRCADSNNSLCRWDSSAAGQRVKNLFGRQAIPMVWDFAEANVIGDSSVCWLNAVDITATSLESIVVFDAYRGNACLIDAASSWDELRGVLVSTDPPYYDNIGYAALSDFFYVWLRRTIGDLYPDLFKTILVPKDPELTAAPERFEGDKEKAKEHFEAGFRKAFTSLREKMDPRYPLTVYYAFKQEDQEAGEDDAEGGGLSSDDVDLTTGWETLLEALLGSGFQITATWPVRASQAWRMRAMGSNALASYIVLACRRRPADAPQCSRREFVVELKRELPPALRHLQQGNIAPVDLAQGSIGPGMAVFSRYAQVIEASGRPMTVRTALALINQTLDEVLAEQEGEFDAETRWALAWFEQNGTGDGTFGEAEILSKAKNTAVNGLVEAGLITAGGGKVKLVGHDALADDWDPTTDRRPTIWGATHRLIRALEQRGESGAADLLRHLRGGLAEAVRDLAYRLHKICQRKKWTQEAQAYNGLVVAWPEIARLAQAQAPAGPRQEALF